MTWALCYASWLMGEVEQPIWFCKRAVLAGLPLWAVPMWDRMLFGGIGDFLAGTLGTFHVALIPGAAAFGIILYLHDSCAKLRSRPVHDRGIFLEAWMPYNIVALLVFGWMMWEGMVPLERATSFVENLPFSHIFSLIMGTATLLMLKGIRGIWWWLTGEWRMT